MTENKKITHLNFIYNRLKDVHGENPNIDYMVGLRLIIDELTSNKAAEIAQGIIREEQLKYLSKEAQDIELGY